MTVHQTQTTPAVDDSPALSYRFRQPNGPGTAVDAPVSPGRVIACHFPAPGRETFAGQAGVRAGGGGSATGV